MNRVKEQWLVTAKRGDFYGLAAQFGLDPVTIRLLVNRGMKNAEDIKKYLYADWRDEYDPRLMKGAAEGAQLLYNAIQNGERIMIASDFDVDGIFSGRILLEAITACGGTAVLKAPDRVKEGYGVNPSMVEKAREQIENERETALRDIRRQVALLSVDVAEKVLREKLSNDQAQQALIDRFVNESRSNS